MAQTQMWEKADVSGQMGANSGAGWPGPWSHYQTYVVAQCSSCDEIAHVAWPRVRAFQFEELESLIGLSGRGTSCAMRDGIPATPTEGFPPPTSRKTVHSHRLHYRTIADNSSISDRSETFQSPLVRFEMSRGLKKKKNRTGNSLCASGPGQQF